LGLYLQSIDPKKREWQWQVKRTIMYCGVHFKRGIDESDFANTADGEMMKGLPLMESQEVYLLFTI
jgi:hypothetical protein